MTTIKYTTKEIAMIKVFYVTSVDCCGRCDDEENMSYMNAKDLQEELGGNLQSIGGIMASLLDKGVIVDQMESARGSRLNDFTLCPSQVPEIIATFN